MSGSSSTVWKRWTTLFGKGRSELDRDAVSLLSEGLTHRVFLSYRSTDRERAEWIHDRLETYRVPKSLVGKPGAHGPIAARVWPVFWDREDSRPASDLETVLADELGKSKHLVVLCTPAACEPGSWVGREIEIFRERRPGAAIYPIIGAGSPPSCFPRQLLSEGSDGRLRMPLAADLRSTTAGGDGRHQAVLKLIAAVIGASPGLLRNRHRRRSIRRASGAAALVFLVAVTVTVLLFRAQESARRERAQSIVQKATAEANRDPLTAALLLRELDTDYEPAGGLAIAVRAAHVLPKSPLPPILVTREFGINTIDVNADGTRVLAALGDGGARIVRLDGVGPPIELDQHGGPVQHAEFSPDGMHAVTASLDHTARLWTVDGRVRAVLRGHSDMVLMARFSPDGTLIATASQDATVRVWRLSDLSHPLVLRGHRKPVSWVAFSPDGTTIVSGSEDYTARLWRLDKPHTSQTLKGHTDRIETAVFDPGGANIVTASVDGTARLWKATGEPGPVLRGGYGEIWSAAFDKTGNRIVTAGTDRTARIWRASDGKQLFALHGHGQRVVAASFSPDTKLVVTSSHDATARLWNAQTGESVAVIRGHTEIVSGATFINGGTSLLTYSQDGSVRMWPANRAAHSKQAEPTVMYGHGNDVTHLVFTPDGRRVVSGSEDGSTRVWDIEKEVPPLVLTVDPSSNDRVRAIAISADGQRVLAAVGRRARSWRLADPTKTSDYEHRSITCAAFTPDGQHVATGGWDDTIRIWPIDGEGKPAVIPGIADGVLDLAFSNDGSKLLAISSQDRVHVWRSDGAREIAVLEGHTARITSAVFSRDGRRILTASEDHTARIWFSDGSGSATVLPHDSEVRSAMFSPDESRVVTTSYQGVQVWRTDGPHEPLVFRGHDNIVTTATFSPDGARIASGGWDKAIRIWNVNNTGEVILLPGHQSHVTKVVFSPDGKRLASASDDKSVRVWRLDWRLLMSYIKDVRTECLTPQQRTLFLGEPNATAQAIAARCAAAGKLRQ